MKDTRLLLPLCPFQTANIYKTNQTAKFFPGFITICLGSGQQILASAAGARLFCVR